MLIIVCFRLFSDWEIRLSLAVSPISYSISDNKSPYKAKFKTDNNSISLLLYPSYNLILWAQYYLRARDGRC